jgi:ubiquinone/menaquinone biosynthesis C-methylase UbiE
MFSRDPKGSAPTDTSKMSNDVQEYAEELSVLDGYAAWAERYDDEDNPLALIEAPAVREACGDVFGKRVLDVGCGTGRHSIPLAEMSANVVGLDFSPEMLAVARRRIEGLGIAANVEFQQHALPEPFPFADESFDLVVMGLVIEHVSDLEGVFSEACRVLESGGRCIVSALHPDRTAVGQRARFIDPDTGLRTPIATIHRSESEYLASALAARFTIEQSRTLLGTHELAEGSPRAAKYVGLPLGWLGVFRKANDHATSAF